MRRYADKPSIMRKTMKRTLILFILLLCLVFGLSAQQEWLSDAVRGDEYYKKSDYNAAWLFYERALAGGCDDGLFLYRAADSFRRQEIEENPEFGEALYAIAHHFLLEQYPDNPARKESEKYFDRNIVVNRRFLKDTYSVVGGEAPRIRNPVGEGLGAVSGFFGAQADRLRDLWMVLTTQGIREAASWVRARFFQLLFAWIVLSAFTGIILPVVMALTVVREGRKSYVTAYAFLFHWGIFGIHRFYLGRYLSGVVWLLTAGLFGIGVFFDIFLTGAYVRFWNEDHKADRPAAGASASDRFSRSTSKPYKAPKPAKPAKKKKTKAAKSGKSTASQNSSAKARPMAARPAAHRPAESGSAGPAASSASASLASAAAGQAAYAEIDDDFGDFSDISFDDGAADALDSSSDSGLDDFDTGISDSFDEDELDLKSFE